MYLSTLFTISCQYMGLFLDLPVTLLKTKPHRPHIYIYTLTDFLILFHRDHIWYVTFFTSTCNIYYGNESNTLKSFSVEQKSRSELKNTAPTIPHAPNQCACVIRLGHYFVPLKLQMNNRLNVSWNELNINTRKEHFPLVAHRRRHKWSLTVNSSLSCPALRLSVGLGGRKQCAKWQPR